MKKPIIAVAAALMSWVLCAYAEGGSVMYSTYDFSSDTVTITGSAAGMKAMISFIILPEGTEPDSLTPETINENQYMTYQMRNENDGSFGVELQLPKGTKGGRYTVYAFCDGEELSSQFMYLSASEVESCVSKINSSNAAGAADLIRDNSIMLGVADECLQYTDEIAVMLKENQPSGGFTAESFISEMNRCSAVVLIRHDAELDDVIRNYGAALGAELSGEISALGDEYGESFRAAVKANANEGNSTQLLYRCIMMTKIANSASYVEMSSYIEQYNEKTGLNEDLSSVTVDTYKELFDSDISTYSLLRSRLSSLLDDQPSGGGSGGSGGGGGGTVSSGASSSGTGGGGTSVPATSNGAGLSGQQQPSSDESVPLGEIYTDISGHWGRECIEKLSAMGIISGYEDGSFRPDNYVTRAEFVKLIVSALNIPESSGSSFSDVSEADWYYGYISAGAQRGIINGYGSEFRPNDNIKRQDAAVIIYRVMSIETAAEPANYNDEADIADYASEAVNTLTAVGVIGGSDGMFLPENGTTRAEAAAMIDRMLEYNS